MKYIIADTTSKTLVYPLIEADFKISEIKSKLNDYLDNIKTGCLAITKPEKQLKAIADLMRVRIKAIEGQRVDFSYYWSEFAFNSDIMLIPRDDPDEEAFKILNVIIKESSNTTEYVDIVYFGLQFKELTFRISDSSTNRANMLETQNKLIYRIKEYLQE